MSSSQSFPPQQDAYGHEQRHDLLPFVPGGIKSVLDVGCAHGSFASLLHKHIEPAPVIDGIEPVGSAAAVAKANGVMRNVFEGYFPSSMPEGLKYDLICFNDVLEHVLDPAEMLRDARSHLSQTGRIMASIPSIQYAPVVLGIVRGRFEYTDSGPLDRTHIRFFTRQTILQLFRDTGYQVEMMSGINPVGRGRAHASGPWRRRAIELGQRALRDSAFMQFVVVARP